MMRNRNLVWIVGVLAAVMVGACMWAVPAGADPGDRVQFNPRTGGVYLVSVQSESKHSSAGQVALRFRTPAVCRILSVPLPYFTADQETRLMGMAIRSWVILTPNRVNIRQKGQWFFKEPIMFLNKPSWSAVLPSSEEAARARAKTAGYSEEVADAYLDIIGELGDYFTQLQFYIHGKPGLSWTVDDVNYRLVALTDDRARIKVESATEDVIGYITLDREDGFPVKVEMMAASTQATLLRMRAEFIPDDV